ncbi:helix-turn-helix transcriptional regulator [Clostridium sp.]|jgi:transcriptional regulator with XRE-family HTH domain|uniref:helix-turn-helix transcriptional regulator n=1 Tax=Clostridium sp. TaxID=1506 RepID=UPI002585646B|nr:helix-turn-helix transcriptional regulator [Clostridium sp.]MDF2502784.1 putative DNA-binding protein [Clostridium sp.]
MVVLNIKKFRNGIKLSKTQLSKRSKIARGYITELEEGKYENPSLQIICKLCIALKITPNDLIVKELYQSEKN